MSEIFGSAIGRYILLEQLGEGGMAKVYNAYDPHMEMNVAVKVILPAHQSSDVFLERFLLEARSLAQLSHTNIVKVLDYGEENHRPFIVMDFIGQGTLKEHLSQPVPWERAAAFLAPVARALEYVHKQKIVHRDVKPSNILIDNNNQPMLSDFGVVKLMEEEVDVAANGVGIGTPDYMSPEQGTGKEADFRADIYALGVVLFEMITGQKPYAADTPMAVVIQHVTAPFPRPRQIIKDIPIEVERAVLKAVQKDPNRRYKDMGEFAEVLEQLAKGKKADMHLVRKLTALRMTNWKWVRTAAAAGIAAVMILTLALFWRPSPGDGTPAAHSDVTPTAAVSAAPGSSPVPTKTSASSTPSPTAAALLPQPTAQEVFAAAMTDEKRYVTHPGVVSLEGEKVTPFNQNAEFARWGYGGINSVQWNPDGTQLLLGTTNGGFVFGASDLSLQYFLDHEKQGWMDAAIYSLDGKTVYGATRTGVTAIFRLDSAAVSTAAWLYNKPRSESERLTDKYLLGIKDFAFDSTGQNLAIAHANGAVNIFNTRTGTATFSTDTGTTATSLAFSSDGRYLYVASKENNLIVYDVATGRAANRLANTSRISLVEMSPKGSYFLTAGDVQSVYYWDAVDEKLLHTYHTLGASPVSLAISPDESRLAIGLSNGRIKVFAPPAAGALGTYQKELFEIEGHSDPITGLAFSPDGKKIASTSWKDGLRIWESESTEELGALNTIQPQVQDMRFSPDGRLLAVKDASSRVRVWDVAAGKAVYSITGYLPEGDVFSPRSDLLVIAVEGQRNWEPGQLLIVDASSGEVMQVLENYVKGWRVYFYPDQSIFVAGNLQKAFLWDISTWQKLNTHGGPNSGCGQFYTPDNRLLAVVSDMGIFHQFNSKVNAVCVPRPLGTVMQSFSYTTGLGIYTVDNGIIFTSDPLNVNTGWLKTDKTLRNYKDRFVASQDDMYAFVRDNLELIVVSGSRRRLSIPWVTDYGYVAAFSTTNNYMALGTRFGSIHLYQIQPRIDR